MRPPAVAPGDEVLVSGNDLDLVTSMTFFKADGKTELYTVKADPKGEGTEASANRKVGDDLEPRRVKISVSTDDDPPEISDQLDAVSTNA